MLSTLIKLSDFSAKAMKQIVCSKFFLLLIIDKLKDDLQSLEEMVLIEKLDLS